MILLLLALPAAAEEPMKHPRVTFHAKPSPRAAAAVNQDWTGFLGPSHDAVSRETMLLKRWPKRGPRLLWSFRKGEGYASPAIKGARLVLFHRVDNLEVVVCLKADTGGHYWTRKYPTAYRDRFNFGKGPRSSPVIDGDRVFTFGVEFKLHCLDLATGATIWKRDLAKDYPLRQEFFGNSTTPLVEGNHLVINIGAKGGPCVIALDKRTGKQIWAAGKRWGRSYASPVPGVIHGQRKLLVMAGGESDPPHGGLLCIDPDDGQIDLRVSWRSKKYASVNASNPVVIGNQVFISSSYQTGGALVTIHKDFSHTIAWKSKKFATHWNTSIHHGGHLYGFDGRHMKSAKLVCFEVKTGTQRWRTQPSWQELVSVGKDDTQTLTMTPFRGSLLRADGDFLCLGELGHLLWLRLDPTGAKVLARARLFDAPETWSVPALSRGLIYVSQHHKGPSSGPRLNCYDLRASSP